MAERNGRAKATFIVLLVVGITCFHYFTHQDEYYYHIFYQGLYFLPLIIAGFWFGLRGAVATAVSITALYLPFILMHWRDFSPEDFNRLMEIAIYNIVAAILGHLRDREQDRQQKLLKAESLAAIGTAISTVAHDMKTPLVAIGGFTHLVRKRLAEDDPDREKLDIVIRETHRLENMLKEMLDFSRPLDLHLDRQDVAQIVARSLAMVEDMARSRNVEIKTRFSPQLGPLACDGMRMQQMLINLTANAVQSSPDNDTVTVSAVQNGRNLIIEVSDHGPGIPAENREKVFLPFFTTKKDGTGLGLPIVKKIVEAHAGTLEILDNEMRGTTFKIGLPLDRQTCRPSR